MALRTTPRRGKDAVVAGLAAAAIAIGAIPAGVLFIVVPHDGGPLDADPAWLEGSPFGSFLVPGLALLVLVGGSFLLTALAVLARDPRWPQAAVLAGAVIVGWFAVQLAVVGPMSVLQPVFLWLGLLVGGLGVVALRRERAAA